MEKETLEQAAFRKSMEEVESILSTVLSAKLPSGTDFHYYKTFEDFNQPLQSLRKDVEKVLLKFPGAKPNDAESLRDPDDAYDWMVGLMDDTLARVDKAVDEGNMALEDDQQTTFQAAHAALHAMPKTASQVGGMRASQVERQRRQEEWLAAQSAAGDSLRPQRDFQDAVDNSNAAFKGKLGHWKDFQQAGKEAPDRLKGHLKSLGLQQRNDEPPHPLAEVLEGLEYPSWQLEAQDPQHFKGLDNAPLTFVESLEQLHEMAARLEGARELAVDLENHSFRSFQGFCCLMQLSTREEDFVVDVLKLRSHIGPVLAPFFADPQVVKVLHGADWDVLWLQRDFGIYIANLFDTGQALRVLEHPHFGLAYMLEHFCQIKTDKRYQLADWRIRPLPEEMMLYARMDTHFLLYMYDCLKAELLRAGDRKPPHLTLSVSAERAQSALGLVLERSRVLCLKRYDVERFTDESWMDAYRKYREPQNLNPKQLAAFAGLYAWRDRTARQRDESKDYVLSRRQLLNLARKLPRNPREFKKALMGDKTPSLALPCCNEILEVIAASLEQAEAEVKAIPPPAPKDEAVPAQSSDAGTLTHPEPHPESTLPVLHAGLHLPQDDSAVGGSAPAVDRGSAPSLAGGSALAVDGGSAPTAGPQAELAASVAEPKPDSQLVGSAAGAFALKPRTVAPLTVRGVRLFGTAQGGAAPPPSAPKAVLLGTAQPAAQGSASAFLAQNLRAQPRSSKPTEAAKASQPASAIGSTFGDPTAVPERPSSSGAARPSADSAIPARPEGGEPAQASAESAIPAGILGGRAPKAPQKASVMGGMFGAATPQLPSVLGGIFGPGRSVLAPAATPGSKDKTEKLQEGEKSLEAAKQLRTQFTLPFLAAPAANVNMSPAADKVDDSLDQPSTGCSSRQPETTPSSQPVKTSASNIRAVADALRAETAAVEKGSPGADAAASCSEEAAKIKDPAQSRWWEDDFLPLPISERYPKPHKRPRREAVEQCGAAAVAQILQDGEAVEEAGEEAVEDGHSEEEHEDAAMEDALQQTGLVSDDSSESDDCARASLKSKGKSPTDKGKCPRREGEGPLHSRGESPDGGQLLLGPIFPKDIQGSEDADSEEAAESDDEATAMEADEGFGPSTSGRQTLDMDPQNPTKREGGTAGNTSGSGSGRTLHSQPQNPTKANGADQVPAEPGRSINALDPLGGDDFVPFDYAAARNTAPGLDLGLARAEQNGRGRRGRGRERGGRNERGRGNSRGGRREAAVTVGGSFNPYRMQETELMRGGKRSSTMPRSGNRNMTFGS